MLTTHGHHIPNTPEDDAGVPRARCGGPGICGQCSSEVLYGLRDEKAAQREMQYLEMPDMRPYDKARLLVAQYINARIKDEDLNEIQPLTLKDTYVVWFSKTLQNWKALITTNIPDGMFFEISYNGDKRETYLDAYVKYHNVAIPDGQVA